MEKVFTRKVNDSLVSCECRFSNSIHWGILKKDKKGFFIDYPIGYYTKPFLHKPEKERLNGDERLKFYLP